MRSCGARGFVSHSYLAILNFLNSADGPADTVRYHPERVYPLSAFKKAQPKNGTRAAGGASVNVPPGALSPVNWVR
jgi:hypothetical protein